MKTFRMFVIILAVLSAFFGTSALAQPVSYQSILDAKKIQLEQQLEDRARRIIGGQLDAGQYMLYVKVDLDKQKIGKAITSIRAQKRLRLKSLPTSAIQGDDAEVRFATELTLEQLYAYVLRKTINLTLDNSVTPGQTNSFRSTLTGALSLGKNDQLKVERAEMGSASMKTKLEESAKETAAAKEQARRIESLVRELEIKRQESSTQAQRLDDKVAKLEDQLRREKEAAEALKKQIADQEEQQKEQQKTALGRFKHSIKGLEVPLTLLPIGLILAAVAIWAIRSTARRTDALAEGLQGLATAAQKIAQVASSNAALNAAGPQANEQKALAEQANQQALPESSEGVELAHQEALSTWEILKQNRYAMLSTLKDWLAEPEGRTRFLQFSDAIGAENARELWQKFPKVELEILEPLLFKPIQKSVAYATVLQLYRFVARESTGKPPFFTKLDLDFLIALEDFELAEVMDNVPVESASCCLLFVSPKRALRLFSSLKKHPKDQLLQGMKALVEMDQDTAVRHAEMLKSYKPKTSETKGFDLSEHMVALLESSSAQTDAKQAVSRLLDGDTTLGAKVRARVMTFADVLRLDDDTLGELVTNLSPEQVATLIFPLAEQEADRFARFFSDKVKAGIRQELQRIAQKASLRRTARVESGRLQQAMVRRVKQLVEQGQIELVAPPVAEISNAQPETQNFADAAPASSVDTAEDDIQGPNAEAS